MNTINGMANALYRCNNNRVEELNNRIADRNIPSNTLQPQYSIRPSSTKYGYMPILDQYKKTNEPLLNYKSYNVKNTFNPGNAQAPWNGFVNNINVESQLRNQFFALQNCEQSAFVPSSNSDLYQTIVDYTPQKQTHTLLFDKPEFKPFNPNTMNVGNSIFNNSTRVEMLNTDEKC